MSGFRWEPTFWRPALSPLLGSMLGIREVKLLASVDISTSAPWIMLNEQHIMSCTSTKLMNCTGMQDSSWTRCPQMEGHWKKMMMIMLGIPVCVCVSMLWLINPLGNRRVPSSILPYYEKKKMVTSTLYQIITWNSQTESDPLTTVW
jgi:hypothetical protein